MLPPRELTETKLLSGAIEFEFLCDRRDSPCGCPPKAPSDEGAGVFRRKMTEGEKAINSKFSLYLPQSFFFEKCQLPRQREPMFVNAVWSTDKIPLNSSILFLHKIAVIVKNLIKG